MASSSQQNSLVEQQDASINIEGSNQISATTVTTHRERGFDLIFIPGQEEEYRRVWETQVLLSTSLNNKTICFVGPYRPRVDLEDIEEWFHTHDGEYPIIHKESIRTDF